MVLSSVARAGTYSVTACGEDGNAGPVWIGNSGGSTFAGASCPGPPSAQITGLVVQSTGAAATCCPWSEVRLTAPGNTSIIALNGQWNWNNQNAQSAGWTAGIMDQNSTWWIGGPSQIGSTGFGSWLDFAWNFNTDVNQIRLVVQCVAASCPSTNGAYAYLAMRYLTFTLANFTAPAIANAARAAVERRLGRRQGDRHLRRQRRHRHPVRPRLHRRPAEGARRPRLAIRTP